MAKKNCPRGSGTPATLPKLQEKCRKNEDAAGQTTFILKNFQGKVTKAVFVEMPAQIKGIENRVEYNNNEANRYQ